MFELPSESIQDKRADREWEGGRECVGEREYVCEREREGGGAGKPRNQFKYGRVCEGAVEVSGSHVVLENLIRHSCKAREEVIKAMGFVLT